MAYSKAFPKRSDKSVYPQWEDVYLSEEEESQAEEDCRKTNNELMQECLADAKQLLKDHGVKDYVTATTAVATALFEKRASHVVYHKEELAKKKFDDQQ